jgi:hypothetical protein
LLTTADNPLVEVEEAEGAVVEADASEAATEAAVVEVASEAVVEDEADEEVEAVVRYTRSRAASQVLPARK